MKKYNSVFTIALSMDHDKEDASDITMGDIIEAMKTRLHDVEYDDPMETLVTGPDDTYKNTFNP
tara:strand:- start:531 stop:722 length:192 start_codon:yes stop_codon:yes gene_type:complete